MKWTMQPPNSALGKNNPKIITFTKNLGLFFLLVVDDDQSGLPERSKVADEVHAAIVHVWNEASIAVVDNIDDESMSNPDLRILESSILQKLYSKEDLILLNDSEKTE